MKNQKCFGITINKPKLFQRIFAITNIVLLIILSLEISLVGKSLTYFLKFIPQSTQTNLLTRSNFIITQILILLLSTLLIFSLPIFAYAAFYRTLRTLFISSSNQLLNQVIIIGIDIITLVACVYFLGGASAYRAYLDKLSQYIGQNPNYCNQNICNVANCIRISSYQTAKNMTISFMVISQISLFLLFPMAFLINKAKLKSELLQIII